MTRTWLCCGLSRPSAAPRCRLQWPPDRASEEVSRWPENLCQHTTSGLECARGQQRSEWKDGGMCARNGDFGREVLKRGKGRKPRQHRGNGQKNPNRIRVGISHYGGGGRNRTAVRKYSVPGPTCLSWPLGLVAGQHDRQSAPGSQSARFNQGWADGHVSAVP